MSSPVRLVPLRTSTVLVSIPLLLGIGALAGWCIGRRPAVPGAASTSVPVPPDDSAVVARVAGQVLTRAQLESRWTALDPQRRAAFEHAGGRKALVDEVVDEMLLAAEAHARGIDARPEVA